MWCLKTEFCRNNVDPLTSCYILMLKVRVLFDSSPQREAVASWHWFCLMLLLGLLFVWRSGSEKWGLLHLLTTRSLAPAVSAASERCKILERRKLVNGENPSAFIHPLQGLLSLLTWSGTWSAWCPTAVAVCANTLLFLLFVLVKYSHMVDKMHWICEARR